MIFLPFSIFALDSTVTVDEGGPSPGMMEGRWIMVPGDCPSSLTVNIECMQRPWVNLYLWEPRDSTNEGREVVLMFMHLFGIQITDILSIWHDWHCIPVADWHAVYLTGLVSLFRGSLCFCPNIFLRDDELSPSQGKRIGKERLICTPTFWLYIDFCLFISTCQKTAILSIRPGKYPHGWLAANLWALLLLSIVLLILCSLLCVILIFDLIRVSKGQGGEWGRHFWGECSAEVGSAILGVSTG